MKLTIYWIYNCYTGIINNIYDEDEVTHKAMTVCQWASVLLNGPIKWTSAIIRFSSSSQKDLFHKYSSNSNINPYIIPLPFDQRGLFR